MSEAKDKETPENMPESQEKKSLTLSGKGTLSLKTGLAAPSRSGFAGRPGSVAVEVKRKRTLGGAETGQSEDVRLTSGEREARARALREAMESGPVKTALPRRQTIESKKREEEQKRQELGTDARSLELAELKRIEAEEQKPGADKKPPGAPLAAGHRKRFLDEEEQESFRNRLKKAPPKVARVTPDRTRDLRLTVTQALNEDYARERGPSLAAQKRAREKARLAALSAGESAKKIVREVVLPETITVQDLANRMAAPGGEVVKTLMKLGVMATITQTIDADTAELVVSEFGHKVRRVTDADVEIGLGGTEDSASDMMSRPPVVTIMGHVDHGKTSLLDALRSTDVAGGEAGGITQHIGAYQVTMKNGARITFLDTPGHAAFTEMRARGANVTDIVVIVVAADDSIMPQTIEGINHARAAKVPIIIAINKIDLPDANPSKVKTALLQHEVVVEEMGGEVLCIEVSAKQRLNLDKLEEAILLQSEVLELKANPLREAQGVIIESRLEKGRGPVATVLIQKGTLRIGDIFVAGSQSGKVRALIDDHGKNVETGIPGQPIEVLGLNGAPDAGDMFSVVADEAKAREIADYRSRKNRAAQAVRAIKGRTTMEELLAQRDAGEKTRLPVLVKADVHGSLEAIAASFDKMAAENEGIEIQILHSGVGGITESDVTLARASGGVIIGFNVRANAQARALAQQGAVDMRYYNVIYDVIDDAKKILTGMLSPTRREEYLGQAQILQVFNITKVGKVAGCRVVTGVVRRGAKVRLLRDDVVIHEGTLKTLKRHQDEVKDVKEGTECGMAFENYDDIKANDVIECYEIVEEARVVT